MKHASGMRFEIPGKKVFGTLLGILCLSMAGGVYAQEIWFELEQAELEEISISEQVTGYTGKNLTNPQTAFICNTIARTYLTRLPLSPSPFQ